MTHYDKTFALFMQPCPCLGPDLELSLRLVALILQMAAIGFGDSLPTAAGRRKCLFVYLFMSTK